MSAPTRSSGQKPASASSTPHQFDVPKPQTPSKLLKSPVRRSPSRSPLVGPTGVRSASKRIRDDNLSDLRLDAASALSMSVLSEETDIQPAVKRHPRPTLSPLDLSESDSKALEDLWAGAKVSSLIKTQTAVKIDSQASLVSAFKTLAKHGIMSAPVWDESSSRIIGLLDYRDLCALVIRVLTTSAATPTVSAASSFTAPAPSAGGAAAASAAGGISPLPLTASASASGSGSGSGSAATKPADTTTTTTASSTSSSVGESASTISPSLTSTNASSSGSGSGSRSSSRSTSPLLRNTSAAAAAVAAAAAASAPGTPVSSSSSSSSPAPSSVAVGKLTLNAVLEHAPAGLVVDYSHRDAFYSVPETGSLLDVISYFTMGLHRVCVLSADTSRRFLGVISQSDALRYLASHLSLLPAGLADRSLSDLGLIPTRPLSVPKSAPVLAALRLMQEHGVSSLAVLDAAGGSLVANLSMTDIKYVLATGQLSLFQRPCSALISEVRRRRDEEAHFETKVPVFYCTPDTPLRRVIGMLCATRTHRLWVTAAAPAGTAVAEPQPPIAVVTLTDVLSLLAPKSAAGAIRLPASLPKGVKPVAFVPAV